jgi:hypothetical protein
METRHRGAPIREFRGVAQRPSNDPRIALVQLDPNVDARRKFQPCVSPCGDTNTVKRSILMGNGTDPLTVAPVRFAVSTISRADLARQSEIFAASIQRPSDDPRIALVQLDLNVNARRQLELHEGIDGLVRRIQDVHEALVGADFELVTRILVAMRRDQYRETLHLDGQRHRPLDRGARALRGVDDLARGLVDQAMIESLEPDPNILISHV